ncbi:peptidylprolyl isomerase [Ornithinimicrobium cerasi]|uniref:Peptidyl-prolyl cis-trans isomerase n=1 Tax=Ornithinimicrobium cerasi TaxID=2248773 RepID=A0A285VJM0_9MICO|nr:peptidylprolyl isomerase [Ornithinimicrobium cerasi]SOC54285.1 peptidyl-prolyl cis-trans isomerase B (cyclophilin B) [Ornithinimicrobium cerasi]
MRRRSLPVLLSLLALPLAGCGSGNATFPGAQDTATVSATGADGAALACEEPPAAPADVRSFTQDDLPQALTGDPATLTATLATTCGDIVLELDAAAAPQTVASFAFLAEEGYWDDSPCHRLTTSGIYVLQCGDPSGTGRGNPGYGYGIENAPEAGVYPAGTLAMARTADPESNGGQFFVVYEETQLPTDGGGYSVFGRVTEGLDIVEAIAAAGAEGGAPDGPPAQPVSILSVEVDEG